MADPIRALFDQYTVRDPATGRYFLPFANTYSGMDFLRRGSGFIGNGGEEVVPGSGQNDDPLRYQQTGTTYNSLNDYFNALDPNNGGFYVTGAHPDGTPVGPSDAQNALVSSNATRGIFNDQPGYFFDPSSIGGIHPATTSGGKPGETGLTNLLGILAGPFLSTFSAFGAGAGEVGSSAFDGSVPAASGESGAALGGSTESSTLSGGSGTDTLGGSTDNYYGEYLTPDAGDPTLDPNYKAGTDMGNYDSSDYRIDNPDQFPAGTSPDILDSIKNLPSAAKDLLTKLFTGGGSAGGKPTLGQSILGQLGSDPLGAAFSATPFLLALHEANKQGGDINDTIGRMRSLEDSVSGNASPYMNALLNPYDQQTGTGRAALLQDQGLRGIRGSSFGDQSLNSYDYTRDLGRGDIASKALLGSAGLQGNLMNSELGAINARNTNRNLLLGAGLSASGRLFQPQQDPFNMDTLKTLMGIK